MVNYDLVSSDRCRNSRVRSDPVRNDGVRNDRLPLYSSVEVLFNTETYVSLTKKDTLNIFNIIQTLINLKSWYVSYMLSFCVLFNFTFIFFLIVHDCKVIFFSCWRSFDIQNLNLVKNNCAEMHQNLSCFKKSIAFTFLFKLHKQENPTKVI